MEIAAQIEGFEDDFKVKTRKLQTRNQNPESMYHDPLHTGKFTAGSTQHSYFESLDS